MKLILILLLCSVTLSFATSEEVTIVTDDESKSFLEKEEDNLSFSYIFFLKY